jgi:hypothetical protein
MSWATSILLGAFLVIVGVVCGLAIAAILGSCDNDQWPDGGAQ